MKPSEVTHINRQKYMAELSKLLAFMFKEDKEDILAQYNKMLDEADDEQALLESFGSPTKLAVTISRTYKRSERKLAVEADSKEDKPEATEHIIVTPVKREKEKPSVTDTGLSYADIIEEIRREKAAEEGVEYKPMFYDEPEETAVQEELEETQAEETQTEETITEQEPAEESAPVEEAAPEEAETETTAESPEKAGEAAEEEATVVERTAEEKAEAIPEEAPAEEAETAEEVSQPEEAVETELVFEKLESIDEPEATVLYKTNVALLILYLIFAIPIGLVLLALSIAVTLILLGLGVLVIAAGVKVIAFAFSTLVIFADIMLCAGAVLIAFAIALLLLWLCILMLVRGIKGVVGGVVSLGKKLCVKEVSVNG